MLRRIMIVSALLLVMACGDSTGPTEHKNSVVGTWNVSLVEVWALANPAQIVSTANPGMTIQVGSPSPTQMTVLYQGQTLIEGFAVTDDVLTEYPAGGGAYPWRVAFKSSTVMTWTAMYDPCDCGEGMRITLQKLGS